VRESHGWETHGLRIKPSKRLALAKDCRQEGGKAIMGRLTSCRVKRSIGLELALDFDGAQSKRPSRNLLFPSKMQRCLTFVIQGFFIYAHTVDEHSDKAFST
jgi:hypothetical protein